MTLRKIDIDGREPVPAIPGPAPMLQWVALDRLVIDDDYQRPLGRANWAAIQKIADNFAWSRFQPLLVAPIEGGMFAVIDGQHRAHAAMICGFAEVPAMAVQVGAAEQSKAFAWVNSQSIRVTQHHIYKAALSAGEDWAVRAEAAVSGGGCRLMPYNKTQIEKKPGEVFCIGLIRKAIEAGQDDSVRAALAAICACPPLAHRPASFSDFILQPWIGAVSVSMVRDPEVLAAALELRNPFKVIEEAGLSLAGGTPLERKRKALMQQIMAALRARAAA